MFLTTNARKRTLDIQEQSAKADKSFDSGLIDMQMLPEGRDGRLLQVGKRSKHGEMGISQISTRHHHRNLAAKILISNLVGRTSAVEKGTWA